MGPENKGVYTLYLGGAPAARGLIQFPEIQPAADAAGAESVLPPQTMEFTMRIKIPKHWRCGSRRRFVKLMMSEGISRNYAEKLAGFTRTWTPYWAAWWKYIFYKTWKGAVQVEHFGDITKLNGYRLPAADVVIGGSPC